MSASINLPAPTEDYMYPTLDLQKGDIRLLRLLPGKWYDDICCELFRARLDENPKYKALSYAWREPCLNARTKFVWFKGYKALSYQRGVSMAVTYEEKQPQQGTKPSPKEDTGLNNKQNQNQVITINEQSFKTKGTVGTALRYLRYPHNDQVLWVDSVCINQGNTLEQNHQVGLMGQIYQSASEVLIWLGSEPGLETWKYEASYIRRSLLDEADALHSAHRTEGRRKEILTNISGIGHLDTESSSGTTQKEEHGEFRISMLESASWTLEPSKFVLDVFSFIQALAETCCEHLYQDRVVRSYLRQPKVIMALQIIMKRAWWDRIWVVQETILPPKASVIFGSLVVPWLIFVEAAVNYNRHAHGCCSRAFRMLSSQQMDALSQFSQKVINLFEVRTISRARMLTASELSIPVRVNSPSYSWINGPEARKRVLLHLLWTFRSKKATDDRDKIYALAGMVTDRGCVAPLRPDYSLSPAQVYQDITYHILQCSQTLDILMGNLEKERYKHLPSWVTDWSNTSGVYELERLHYTKLFSASSHTTAELGILQNSILTVRGFQLSRITKFGSCLEDQSTLLVAVSILCEWQAICHESLDLSTKDFTVTVYDRSGASRFVPTLVEAQHTVSDKFWRTICSNIIRDPSAIDGYRKAIGTDQKTYVKWTKQTDRRARDRRGLYSDRFHAANPPIYDSRDDAVSQFDHSIRAATIQRRFFVTSDGFVGLGPASIKKDDEIWILLGGRAPFILRPNRPVRVDDEWRPCYELVGYSYVHGIMDGEAIECRSLDTVSDVYLR